MKKWLAGKVICPQCLPQELSLELTITRESSEDIISGKLTCSACRQIYTIDEGIAVIVPEETLSVVNDKSGYNSGSMLSSYLWSHFCDLLNDPDATSAYEIWSSYFRDSTGPALDIGCSVGRLSFEMSQTHDMVIGIDTSKAFIQKARELLTQHKLEFDLIIEGHITENKSFEFNNGWQFERVEFLVADAMALPFPRHFFSTVASINILEKVPDPLKHFIEINRIIQPTDSTLVFSDPFSWDPSVSNPESWLSGRNSGRYKGRGIDNIKKIFQGMDKIIDPPMKVIEEKDVAWKIRKTQNLWEYINSQLIIGRRE